MIVTTNHSEFERPEVVQEILRRASPGCLLVDPWNSFGTAQVFSYASEAAVMRSAETRLAGAAREDPPQ